PHHHQHSFPTRRSSDLFTDNAAQNIEIYGWIIYNGGHKNSVRSDGHGIYVKNDGLGTKIARDNVIFNMFGYGIHAFSAANTGERSEEHTSELQSLRHLV